MSASFYERPTEPAWTELIAARELALRLYFEGALFVLNLASEGTFDGDEAETMPGRPSQRKGIELSASYKLLPWLRLDGDFAATHARYANGDPAPPIPSPAIPAAIFQTQPT
jgi:outer membrane receptor protein involved in Fe transport